MQYLIKQKLSNFLSHANLKRVKRIYHSVTYPLVVRKRIMGHGNSIKHRGAILKNVVFSIQGDNNTIEIQHGAVLEDVNIQAVGSRHHLFIGAESWVTGCRFFFEDKNCRITLAGKNKFVDTKISAAEDGSKIIIGLESQCSGGSDIRTTDSHSLIDLDSGKRINPAHDVLIGDHVWIGEGVVILKGVHIGEGSMVAVRSVVTKSFPSNCIIGGNPARIIRRNTSWKWERI